MKKGIYWISFMALLLALGGGAAPTPARAAVPITLSGKVLDRYMETFSPENLKVVVLKAGVTWNNYKGALHINLPCAAGSSDKGGDMEIVQSQVLEVVSTRWDGSFFTTKPLAANTTYAIAIQGHRYLQTYFTTSRSATGVQNLGVLRPFFARECGGGSDPAASRVSSIKLNGDVVSMYSADDYSAVAGAKLTFLKLGVTPRSYTGRSRDVREVTYTDREGMFSTRNSFSKDSTYYVRLEAAGYIPVWIMFTPSIQARMEPPTDGQLRIDGFSLIRR